MVSLLGGALLFNNNSYQQVKADSFTSSERYWILNMNSSYGVKEGNNYSITAQAYNSLATPYYFEEVSGKSSIYYIRNLYSNNYLARLGKDAKYYSNTNVENCNFEWKVVESGGYTYIRDTSDSYYLNLTNNVWGFELWANLSSGDNARLNLLSFDASTTSFVTAMKNINCDDKVNGPSVDEWDTAKDAYDALIAPAKNYLRYVSYTEADKDDSNNSIEWAMSKYDFVINKYNKSITKYTEFVTSRDTHQYARNSDVISFASKDTNTYIALAVLISSISLVGIGSFLFLRKKKN